MVRALDLPARVSTAGCIYLTVASLGGKTSEVSSRENPKSVRQHYVSRVLLRRFSKDPTLKNGLVGQFDVVNGKPLPARTPGAIGYERYFIKYDGDRMEGLWGTVETPMRSAFDALSAGMPELLEKKHTQITDFIALHYARSLEAQKIHQESLNGVEARARSNRELQARLANIKYGLDLSKAPSILDEMAEAVLSPIQRLESQGSLFQEWVESVFQQTRQHLANYSLSIRPAAEGDEYLLGDCPATGVAPGMAPRKRPPLLDAKVLILPLTPRYAVMAYPPGPSDPMFSVDPAEQGILTAINHGQIAQAHRRVYHRPDSGHGLTVRSYLALPNGGLPHRAERRMEGVASP